MVVFLGAFDNLVLALVFKSGDSPKSYFAKLTAAFDRLGPEGLTLWGEGDLWQPEARNRMGDLLALLKSEGWHRPEERFYPSSISGVLFDAFARLARAYIR